MHTSRTIWAAGCAVALPMMTMGCGGDGSDLLGPSTSTNGAGGAPSGSGASVGGAGGEGPGTCEPSIVDTPGHFVAPDASDTGDGTEANPWTLAAALAHPSGLLPGETVWVRGGTYVGTFVGKLVGEEGSHVTLRSYPGQRAVIDGTLTVEGRFATYRDLEVMSSDPKRVSEEPGSAPAEMAHRGKGVIIHGKNTRFINSIVHDGNGAFGFWKGAVDSEIYGNIVFNGGWIGPDRGHGHALYTQNETGTKRVVDNLMFNQFGRGVQAYGSSTAFVRGYHFEGNVVFNEEFLVGGEVGLVADDITIHRNLTFASRLRMGFANSEHLAVTITDNHLVNLEGLPLSVQRWRSVDVGQNRIHGSSRLAWLRHPDDPQVQSWNQNQYFSSGASGLFEIHGTGEVDWNTWQAATSFDASSTSSPLPSEPQVFVRPNAHEAGRGHLIIYNWDDRAEVVVDLAGLGLRLSERYEIRNAQNYFEEAIEGVFDGAPVAVPMTGWTVANPIGRDEPIEESTFPRFGAFVVRSLGCE